MVGGGGGRVKGHTEEGTPRDAPAAVNKRRSNFRKPLCDGDRYLDNPRQDWADQQAEIAREDFRNNGRGGRC